MGGVPVKHHSKGKVGRRRSHHALKKIKLAVCVKCGGPVLPHRACLQCGNYGPLEAKTAEIKPKKTTRKKKEEVVLEAKQEEVKEEGEVVAESKEEEKKSE
ncbi:MAG: 50S ribosomal protein L32 [Candidatus Harrisonbacteria bacterium]|nr:50S ribosomal protein L32 [Candidatus Harrisonbacteria bacterium]